jgi:hypothetical protein
MMQGGNRFTRTPPSLDLLAKFGVVNPDQYEAIYQPLYHYQNYAAAGQAALTYFNAANGQGALTSFDTNMETPSSLPAPKMFLITSVQCKFIPGNPIDQAGLASTQAALKTQANDVAAVAGSGSLDLFISSKSYLGPISPLNQFPAEWGLCVSSALSDTTAAGVTKSTSSYADFSGPVFTVAPMLLKPTMNFKVNLTWPGGAVALPSATIGRLGVILGGYLYRLSQ